MALEFVIFAQYPEFRGVRIKDLPKDSEKVFQRALMSPPLPKKPLDYSTNLDAKNQYDNKLQIYKDREKLKKVALLLFSGKSEDPRALRILQEYTLSVGTFFAGIHEPGESGFSLTATRYRSHKGSRE